MDIKYILILLVVGVVFVSGCTQQGAPAPGANDTGGDSLSSPLDANLIYGDELEGTDDNSFDNVSSEIDDILGAL